MSERKKSPWLTVAIATCVVLALTGAYVGSYYATVTPTPIELELGGSPSGSPGIPFVADFYEIPIDPGMAETLFAPIHSLDRHMRPNIWEP
ncbi:MAG: hypothetical protein IT428_20775 [Planctomycetaceae bacterium]|nr:hypothetical protein [Planctomycetaceae bacterium]